METLRPNVIVEWIPYSNLENIKYLTKGGFSEIYTAYWIDGQYDEWVSKEKRIKRRGKQKVVLKKLKNIESANRTWFEEGKFHLSINNKSENIVLTKDPSDGNYMLVIHRLDMDLKSYLQQSYNKLTWKEKIYIIKAIIDAIYIIHEENAIHRDLHSGNVLFSHSSQLVLVSDFGFCGPSNKQPNSIYGNLPYIAPEVVSKMEYSFASDIYSIGMLMWEISSGQPPFICKHNYDLAIKIINGMTKIIQGTPLEYKELMERCWDADPTKRPDITTLRKEIRKIHSYYLNNEEQQIISNDLQSNTRFNITSSSINSFFENISSRVYSFKDLPEPRNATKEEQEALYYSIQFNFDLQDGLITDDEKELAFNYKKVKFNNKGDDENLNTKTR
uniref:Protein kinase domain-containing protein n=1 Tax=Rhizophagus irregularis (strain DAOM 181602 / DAOM 197198 / MUCL 43194) TaxID=747089 RepID=U9UMZ0_RHIID